MTGPDDSIVSSAELSDGTEVATFRLVELDLSLLNSPVVLRAIGGIVVGLALLMWPDRTDQMLARLIGAGLVWTALAAGQTALRRKSRAWKALLGPLLALAVGAFLLVNPDQSTVFVGRIIGALLLAYACRSAYRLLRAEEREWSRLAFTGVVGAIGLLLFALTGAFLSVMIAVGALWLVGVSLLALVVSLDARTDGVANYHDTSDLVMDWLRDRPKSVDARQSLYDKILYEGPTTRTRVIRFFTLMGFASVIASMGIITDSTAVVIGAMLVAPLMTPLMGMAISLVMGWPNRLARAAMLAFGGILFAIGIGALLGLIAPAVIDTATNSQIIGRSSPTTLDLITAVAAGGAGAYGLSRPDVSDSLPGVAIAISLVPPLTVVGIAYSQGDWASGNGALLLFATNMIAILIVGGLMFILTGVTPIEHVSGNQNRVQTAVGVTAIGGILVLGALLLNGAQIASDALQKSTVEDSVEAWVPDDTGHRLVQAAIEDNVVTAIIIGPLDGLPDLRTLADDLTADLDRAITVNVSLVVEERLTATGE